MGFNLLVDFLNELKPAHIVQLENDDASKNIPNDFNQSIHCPYISHKIESFASQKYFLINSRCKLNATETRALSLSAYLMHEGSDYSFFSLAAKQPYSVPWSGLYIKFVFDDVKSF